MKIQSIHISRQNLQLTRPYTIAFKTTEHVENVIVQIILENGMIGWGAGNPSPYVVGEDLAATLQALETDRVQQWQGRDIRFFYQLLSEVQEAFPKNPAARAALDIALHDAFAQYLGLPLVYFLGQKIHSLPTSITIGIKNVSETLKEAQEYYERGFKILKIKIGQSLEEDVERLVKLREVYGHQILIRVDSNQGYDSNTMIRFFEQTRSLNIELNEQPLPAKAVGELKALPAEIRKTIAADESLLTPKDAFRLAENPTACGIFNIKLMKCGGVQEALKIATIAQSAGIDLMWGCNDESIISISAALHAALSCPHTKYIDLDGSLDLAQDVVSGGFVLEEGWMRVNGEPGLGVKGR